MSEGKRYELSSPADLMTLMAGKLSGLPQRIGEHATAMQDGPPTPERLGEMLLEVLDAQTLILAALAGIVKPAAIAEMQSRQIIVPAELRGNVAPFARKGN